MKPTTRPAMRLASAKEAVAGVAADGTKNTINSKRHCSVHDMLMRPFPKVHTVYIYVCDLSNILYKFAK